MDGQRLASSSIVTREVRWFGLGSLPAPLVEWFTRTGDFGRERRVDRYDLSSALDGVGLKHRGRSTVDTKTRFDVTSNVRFSDTMIGHVEDWEKTSRALGREARLDRPVAVSKNRLTRRFLLDDRSGAGCEAELVDIELEGRSAWSLCFETFGNPIRRGDALTAGVARFLEETPLPSTVRLDGEHSLAYPHWIASLCCQTA